MNQPTRRLVVVGGGITGLAAAWEASGHEDVGITVLEATDRLGGKIHTSDVVLEDDTTMRLDEGADAFLARVPDAVELCHELGLGGELTQPAVGRAKLAIDGELVFLPAETVLGVPVDGESLRGRGVLSDDAVDAVAAELERHGPPPQGDVAIGPFLSERLDPEVVEHLVSPLVGGINAGDVDQLSLAAVTPQLAEAAADGDSLVAALARRRVPATSDAPVFHGLLAGTGRLIDRLAEALTARGVQIRTGTPVHGLRDLLDDSTVAVVATPAPAAAELLGPVSAEAAEELEAIEHSSVTLVTLVYGRDDVPGPLEASGVLVPRSAGRFMTAVSCGSVKWAHWDDGRHVVLRASAGRTGDERQASMSDDEVVAALRTDLAELMGVHAAPVGVRVSRWPLGFAQYTVGHLERVDRIEAALRRDEPRVVVAGAAYRGLGIPACIRQGRSAATELLG